jgi:hypothetical protein
MFSLHCTKKLLDRIKPELEAPRAGTTRLGNWYATALFWKPQMALVVNERTLLPVLLPLAPAATLAQRFPIALREVLQALDMPAEFIDSEISGMSEVVYAKTANRSILGVMNEFVYLAEGYREQDGSDDPVWLSLRLAGTPCGPLYKGAVFPDKAVRELIQGGVIH